MKTRRIGIALVLSSIACTLAVAETPPISITVDAREAPRRLFHTTMSIAAPRGPLTLVYPKWIPGEHGPTGPIADLAGLAISANGKSLPWRRDPVEMWAIHCDVPEGVNAIEVKLDYLSGISTEGFTDGPAATSQLAFIDWHLMLVYPDGKPTDLLTVAPNLILPEGWKFGTALDVLNQDKNHVEFAPVSLTMLVDSPVAASAHYRRIELTPGKQPEHVMDLIADSDAALAISDGAIGHYKSLIDEAAALYGARHYTRYHFLCTLSDHMSHFGLEHHQCSDDRMPEKAFIDDDERRGQGSLLSHEYTHSWNGKYRRPADLTTPDYLTPMRTSMMWVYEGLTEYLGDVLAARCGNWTPEDYREYIATTTARLDHTSGRRWRPLQDTADSSPFLYQANGPWENWRRGVDFYDEGELIWLEADTLIRAKTEGKKSLDDFVRAFHGPGPQGATLSGEKPSVSPYTFDDVVRTLNEVTPMDWATFLRSRLDSTNPEAPKGGLAAAGWKLVYLDTGNAFLKGEGLDLTYSIGAKIGDDGKLSGIERGSPADAAGLAPSMKLIAVNGRKYTSEVIKAALAAAHEHPAPIDLLVQNDDVFSTVKLDYSGGERYPHLQRDESVPDVLSEILKPRVMPAAEIRRPTPPD